MTRAPLSWLSVAGVFALVVVGSTYLMSLEAKAAPLQCVPACPSETLPSSSITGNATTLKFQRILATRTGDPRSYVLLGSDFFRALSFGDPGVFVSRWLNEHPHATYTVISTIRSTNTKTHKKFEITYIWVSDDAFALNVDLVRQGVFAGATMYDMVDNARGLDRLLQSDPKLADAKTQIAKERAAEPDDRTERLIPEDDYRARLVRIQQAEYKARAEKLGIWSDNMRAEREAEDLP